MLLSMVLKGHHCVLSTTKHKMVSLKQLTINLYYWMACECIQKQLLVWSLAKYAGDLGGFVTLYLACLIHSQFFLTQLLQGGFMVTC